MPIEILMPALSPTMTEGTLARWLKHEGDSVNPGDVLAEIETDKATMEVEAIDGGILGKIFVPEGSENVAVNTLIAALLEEGEDESALNQLSASSREETQDKPSLPPSEAPTLEATSVHAPEAIMVSSNERIIASPLAKRVALQYAIDLKGVKGTGPKGRIVRADVEAFMNNSQEQAFKTNVSPVNSQSGYDDIKLSTMRKVIARRLTESKTTIPHFYLSIECRMDALLAYRQEINASVHEADKVSVNDLVLMAVAKAIRDVPDANASYAETHIRRYHHADISLAVAIEGGLVTPVIRRAETLSLLELSRTVKDLVAKARKGQLVPEDYQGGTFSVSNLGMFGIQSFSAIVNPPQGCILAVGASEKRPVVVNDQVVPGTIMTCTLSVDHRVIDGAVGAAYCQAFKKYMENPLLLLI